MGRVCDAAPVHPGRGRSARESRPVGRHGCEPGRRQRHRATARCRATWPASERVRVRDHPDGHHAGLDHTERPCGRALARVPDQRAPRDRAAPGALPGVRRRDEPWLGATDQGYCQRLRASVRTGVSLDGSGSPSIEKARAGSRDRPLRPRLERAPVCSKLRAIWVAIRARGRGQLPLYERRVLAFHPGFEPLPEPRAARGHAVAGLQSPDRAGRRCDAPRDWDHARRYGAHGRGRGSSDAARRARGPRRQWSSPPADRGGDGRSVARGRQPAPPRLLGLSPAGLRVLLRGVPVAALAQPSAPSAVRPGRAHGRGRFREAEAGAAGDRAAAAGRLVRVFPDREQGASPRGPPVCVHPDMGRAARTACRPGLRRGRALRHVHGMCRRGPGPWHQRSRILPLEHSGGCRLARPHRVSARQQLVPSPSSAWTRRLANTGRRAEAKR